MIRLKPCLVATAGLVVLTTAVARLNALLVIPFRSCRALCPSSGRGAPVRNPWRSSLIGGLMLVLACGTEQPTAPSAVPTPPTISQPPQPLPSGDDVATYVYGATLDHPVRGFTTGSQYLLYDNGVFGLRYDTHVYLGTYRQDDATITFRFDGTWTWDQGIATGTLKGDLLEVRYSDILVHSDFENAVYRRSQ